MSLKYSTERQATAVVLVTLTITVLPIRRAVKSRYAGSISEPLTLLEFATSVLIVKHDPFGLLRLLS